MSFAAAAWILSALAAGYLLAIAVRVGLHHRLPLALGPMSLEAIPDRAAKMHGARILFTSSSPCAWEIPQLEHEYPNATSWSANRIRATTGMIGSLLRAELGMKRGDRVAVLKANHLDVHIFNSAIVRAGGIACPINGNFAAEHLRAYLLNIGAEILISDVATLTRLLDQRAHLGGVRAILVAEKQYPNDPRAARLAELIAGAHYGTVVVWIEEALARVTHECAALPRTSDEPMYLVHTSGTTGAPKAVVLRNGAQSHAVRGWLCYVHLSRSRDKSFVAVPNNHQAVILTFNGALLHGLRVHWNSAYDRDGFEATRVVEQLAREHFTGFFGFPVVYTQLKEVRLDRHDLRHMRFWASTADAMHEDIQRRFVAVGGAFRDAGIPCNGSVFLDAQGSSEVGTPSVLRYVTPFTRKFGRRVGRPHSTPFGPALRLVDVHGRRVRRGDAGRLEVRGKTVFDGYWKDPVLTRRSFHGNWFFTGDVARLSHDGHVVQLDREVDVIHTRSGEVYSLPIEEKVHKHPCVFDACVYGARQSDGSQQPAAAIALRAGATTTAELLARELNRTLTTGEQLHHVDIVPWSEFPMGVTGKTLKRIFAARTESTATKPRARAVAWGGLQHEALSTSTDTIPAGE